MALDTRKRTIFILDPYPCLILIPRHAISFQQYLICILSFSFIHIFFYPRIEHLDHHFKIQNKCTEFIWFNFNETLIAMNEVEWGDQDAQ
jgi:hypothetical protein